MKNTLNAHSIGVENTIKPNQTNAYSKKKSYLR